ncbi:MAG: HlyD family efflux transporter periplasmic adaptor subunit [candidate division WOR-3 bacterium]|nr:HlyD family efflux transporter periplasmic adaptor subunit [candidate division WOR-3 bacterium]
MRKTIFLSFVLFIFSCRGENKNIENIQKDEDIFPVYVSKPKITSIEYSETFTANISGDPLTFVLPEVPGKFIRYTVTEGQYVNKDDIIAYLDRSTVGVEFKEYPVKAPTSGKVHLLNINSGQLVSPTNPIAQIYGNPVAIVKLPSIYYKKINIGDSIKIYSDDLGISESSKIYYKSGIIDPLSQTFEIRAKANKFPIGSFASAIITIDKKQKTLVIPTSAILGLDKKYVFIVESDKAYKRIVKVGISNENFTEILDGLSENDLVVVEGQYNLQDGSKVRVEK